ncbi:hypothetical protein A2U01_0107823, partial [Trifolium medium]|nr:hypothetical protein [Trifolium medium]
SSKHADGGVSSAGGALEEARLMDFYWILDYVKENKF